MLAKENEVLNKAVNKLMFVSAEEKLRYEYEQRQKAIKDYYCDIQDAREEGKEEKAIEIAANLLDVLDDELISIKTGLSIENIKLIRQKNSK